MSDWSTQPKVKAGQGIGAFFRKAGDFNWILLSTTAEPAQSRFYLISHDIQNMLIGIFYAPHAGKPQSHRSDYYRRLHIAWLAHKKAHPQASTILAGDTNIPELHYDINGVMTPTDNISRCWCENNMPGMYCANNHKGKPAATHIRGNTLDLIIYSQDLCLEQCKVGNLSGSDHHPVTATFHWGYTTGSQCHIWKPAKQIPQQLFDTEMSAPLTALHGWAQQRIHTITKRRGSPKRGFPVGVAPSPSADKLAHLADQYAVLMGAII